MLRGYLPIGTVLRCKLSRATLKDDCKEDPAINCFTYRSLNPICVLNRRTPSRALRARMAHLKEGEEAGSDEDPERPPSSQAEVISNADYQAPRRDLLPDIDEINSTLKSTKKRKDRAEIARNQSGFRAGFLLMTLAAIFLVVIYAQAPAIARAMPGSETALISFVDSANSIRDWIDGVIDR